MPLNERDKAIIQKTITHLISQFDFDKKNPFQKMPFAT